MIDLHCHIIPRVDDGAPSAEAACAMAEHALRSGVDTVVATPHCNLRGARLTAAGADYDRAFGMLRALLRQHRIPLTVLPGAELFAHRSNLRQLLDSGKLVTLNHSRYLLAEFRFSESGEEISALLAAIARRGLIPVVAHPERYEAVQESPALAAVWFSRGYVIQLNKGSLLGRLGTGAERTSLRLLRRGLAHVIASDAHDPVYRPTGFASLLPFLAQRCPSDYARLLLEENPRRIIQNQPVYDSSEVVL